MRIRTFLLALLCLPALAGTARAQTADDVVEKYLTALGGRAALGKLTTRKATGTITIATASATIAGPIEAYFKPPNRSRSVVRLDLTPAGGPGEMTAEQVFDGKTGFALNSLSGPSDITGHQLEGMRNNVFPAPLLGYKDGSFKLELLPTEKVNGRDAAVVRATPKVGTPSKIYFDAETHLIVRTVVTVDSPTGGDMEQTGDVSDYRVVDGVKVAFLVVNTNDAQTVTLRFTKIEHNVAIDDAMFVRK